MTGLLHILHEIGLDLPKDARTLLHSKRSVDTIKVAGGEYYYFGLKYWLPIILRKFENKSQITQLTLHINIDGIPLFNSSTMSLWPILGSITELGEKVFPIAIFCSKKKPSPIDDYLRDFFIGNEAV